ncbi:methionine--tRNA ligase [Nocardia seriolae]|uniref:Methionine--tRNA ligase n=1 Tax=Nocardia seriolae TaxID=37332 RepID=A0A0B8NDG2_9NOCA|nr:methionine--tRNA ligase [Nocardia seriolae]APA95688.1 Leucine--tRNA ligase [Nocardia seriolae]MTJ66190.1 methionine--tRNA ligase [Nocardia seriolae]MTJ75599.1 methionine--tRNA ligase [Nocardia seriolae]MTJ85895.1 methionine--tRNA ligase [Nocardia seriolae]MTK29889.1 methionine--tRNA ligase [Nocardia seriolae]
MSASDRPAFYITTAIAYPNGNPHIGHAYEYISSDALARFKRLDGFDVFYMTGTDEHGQKVQQAAKAAGLPEQEYASRNSDVFEAMDKALDISFDRFIRTTDADHLTSAAALWERMVAAGDIYLDTYGGWYSVRDEAFYTDEETTVREDGTRISTDTETPVEWTEESNYFFRLSKYQDRLLALYETHPEFIAPTTRRNEIVSYVKAGLKDFSISRTSFDWGVPVPGDPEHVMYVWVDALTNYLTGVGFPDTDSAAFQRYWPADLHIIGKDISRFHTVYWPAFLMSAGIELPKRVFVHGFVNAKGGEKMSKSLGNVVDPLELVETFGLDAVRFFLLREISYGQDGSYSEEAIVGRINSDLANEYGNLAQRCLKMVGRDFGGVTPTPGEFTADDKALLERAGNLLANVRAEFDQQQIHLGLEQLWLTLGETNRYFSAQAPWTLAKAGTPEDTAREGTIHYVTMEVLRIVSILVQPIIPASAGKILDLLGVTDRDFADIATALVAGTALPEPEVVFPKYAPPKA